MKQVRWTAGFTFETGQEPDEFATRVDYANRSVMAALGPVTAGWVGFASPRPRRPAQEPDAAAVAVTPIDAVVGGGHAPTLSPDAVKRDVLSPEGW